VGVLPAQCGPGMGGRHRHHDGPVPAPLVWAAPRPCNLTSLDETLVCYNQL
jgi:hypothetical protein